MVGMAMTMTKLVANPVLLAVMAKAAMVLDPVVLVVMAKAAMVLDPVVLVAVMARAKVAMVLDPVVLVLVAMTKREASTFDRSPPHVTRLSKLLQTVARKTRGQHYQPLVTPIWSKNASSKSFKIARMCPKPRHKLAGAR